jgi:hypothetical protein
MVRSPTGSEGSAATQVKAVSPEILLNLQGARGCFALKPVSGPALEGESVSACRGHRPQRVLQRMASELGRAVSLACPYKPKEARRGQGDTAVGPAHSRGVVGVVPGAGRREPDPLEGAGDPSNRAQDVGPIL